MKWVTVVLLALCLTQAELETAVCRALCRQEGYDTGSRTGSNDKCLCANEVKFEEEKPIIIRKRFPREEGVPYSQRFAPGTP